MIKRISSTWTAFYKIGLPLLYVVGVATQTYNYAIRFRHLEHDTFFFAFMGASYVAGAVFILWLGRFYKHVELDQGGLNVSGYFVSDFIPFSRVANIKQSRWSNGRPVCILLKEDSPFGRKIAFQPRGAAPLFGEHPIIRELRQRAGLEDPKHRTRKPPPVPPPIPRQRHPHQPRSTPR
jgi:hypothetical protein